MHTNQDSEASSLTLLSPLDAPRGTYLTGVLFQRLAEAILSWALAKSAPGVLLRTKLNVLNMLCPTVVTTPDGTIIEVNSKLVESSGYSQQELLGKNMRIISSGSHDTGHWQDFWGTISRGKVWKGTVCNRRKDGSTFHFHAIVSPIIGDDGKVQGFLAAYHDITERDTLAQALTEHTLGLPGTEELQGELHESKEKILVLFHLNEISRINSSYGSRVGNDVVMLVRRTLMTYAQGGSLYKFGGSEFAMVFPNIVAYREISEEMLHTLEKLSLEYANGLAIPISLTTAGLITNGLGGQNTLAQGEELLSIQPTGLGGLQRLHHSRDLSIDPHEENVQRNIRIAQILKEDLITPYGQLIFRYDNTKNIFIPTKLEALLRIKNGDGTAYLTKEILGDFDRHAKNREKMTESMIEKTFALMQGLDIEFSVNIGTPEIRNPEFIGFIRKMIAKYSINPSRIVFEILEEVDSHDEESIKAFIEALENLGCKTAADDLGAGQSGIKRERLTTNYIKVDLSLTRGVNTNDANRRFIRYIVVLAHIKNMQVIAEGVETAEELKTLMKIGVDLFQGYYFHKPEPLESLVSEGKKDGYKKYFKEHSL